MITIHQAIYGEKSGHALLSSTDQGDISSRISGYTDLSDRPEGGVLSTSIIRGFWVDDHFLLIKTFPDLSSGMRSGRVFSHVLIIEKDDIHKIKDISDLFKFHLTDIDKDALLDPIQYNPTGNDAVLSIVNGRQVAGVNAIVKHSDYIDCIAWLNEEGYWDWIRKIWAQLPKKNKESVRLGAAFDPQRIKNREFSLVYVPMERQANWERHTYKIVGLTESEDLDGPVSEWLVKGTEKVVGLHPLLDDFSPKIQSIQDIKLLYNLGKVYLSIDENPKLNDLLVFSDYISKISKKESEGDVGKKKLLETVLKLLPDTNSNMIKALMYQSWEGFVNAINLIEPVIFSWLNNNLFDKPQNDNQGAIIVQYVDIEKENWWSKILTTYLTEKLEQCSDKEIAIIWEWMLHHPSLVIKHQFWLPKTIEVGLLSKIPKLAQGDISNILKMAQEKGWFILHGVILSIYYTAREAIAQQLEIDKDQSYSMALIAMSKNIKGTDFVDVSVSLNDYRLHKISGNIINKTPSLKKRLNIQNKSWLSIWKESIEQGGNIWEGIQSPKNVLFEVMNILKEGKEFDETLLKSIGENNSFSLKEYSDRELIWDKLPVSIKKEFAETTLFDCIEDIVTRKLEFNSLESFLTNFFYSEEMLGKILNNTSISSEYKIRLFDHIINLQERHARKILEKTLNNEEARLLGKLIKNRNWKTLAEYVYQNLSYRIDFGLIISECCGLLGPFQRLNLKIHGVKSDSINLHDWWDLFSETAIHLYPEGPNQNGLWSNAGGTVADLHLKTNGKTSWRNAIDHLKKEGSQPSVTRLLEEMRKEFHQNNNLNTLYKTK